MPNYKVWSVEEDLQLLSEVGRKLDIRHIAVAHDRGLGAIRSRINKHNFHNEFQRRLGATDQPPARPWQHRLLRAAVIFMIKRWGIL